MHRGYVKAWRAMKDHHLWKHGTPHQRSIIMALLWMANHREKSWTWKGQKFTAQPGQMITSLESIMETAGDGTTLQSVRSALQKFKKFDFITEETTKTGRLITITNWLLYQSDNMDDNTDYTKATTNEQHSNNIATTPNKNVRMKECKNKSKKTYSEVSLGQGGADAPAPSSTSEEKPLTYIQEFIEWYKEEHLKTIGKIFAPNWKRDAGIVKTLYVGLDKDLGELKLRAGSFLRMKTWPENDKSLEHFQKNINRTEGKHDGGREEIDYDEAARPKRKEVPDAV